MVRFGLPPEVTEDTTEIEPSSRVPSSLEQPIRDYLTEEQRKRDEHTTTLYEQFVWAHNEKCDFVKESKKTIRKWCILWVCALILAVLACIAVAGVVLVYTDRLATDVIALISAIVPLLVAIIGTLNIVTKHVFPEDEERYITDIVKLIHENDFKNKQANMQNQNTNVIR